MSKNKNNVKHNPKKNTTMNELGPMFHSSKREYNKWGKSWQGTYPSPKLTFASGNYPAAIFKHNANRRKFYGESENKIKKKKKKRKTKRLARINNKNNRNKNNKNKSNKNPTKKMNETKMEGGRRRKTRRKKRRKTRRKRRKRRGGMNPASSTNSRRANGMNRANAARPNNQVIPVANTAQSDIDFSGSVITGSNFNSNSNSNSNNY